MKTKIANLVLENGLCVEKDIDYVDFHAVPSDDPIAFYFGKRDAQQGNKLPKINSKAYKELAKEYIRGFNTKES